MKRHVASILVAVALLSPMAGTVGVVCLSSGCALVQPGNSALVVRAEQTAKVSFTVIDAVLAYEKAHRDELFKLAPDIKKAADTLRVESPKALEALRAATKAYKANRTPDNEATLATWLAVVDTITARAATLATQAKGIAL